MEGVLVQMVQGSDPGLGVRWRRYVLPTSPQLTCAKAETYREAAVRGKQTLSYICRGQNENIFINFFSNFVADKILFSI